jgi:hypothetical protein
MPLDRDPEELRGKSHIDILLSIPKNKSGYLQLSLCHGSGPESQSLRAPESNPGWAQMARSGEKVMQFLRQGISVANVVDGRVCSTLKDKACRSHELLRNALPFN